MSESQADRIDRILAAERDVLEAAAACRDAFMGADRSLAIRQRRADLIDAVDKLREVRRSA